MDREREKDSHSSVLLEGTRVSPRMGCSSSSVGFHRTIVRTDSSLLVWSMELQARRVLRKSWKLISQDMADAGTRIMFELFGLDEHIRKVFPFGDLTDEQLCSDTYFKGAGLRFMQIIGSAIDNLEDLDSSVGPLLYDIGRKHFHYDGFRHDFFDLFAVAVLRTWRMIIGEKFKSEVAEAWKELIGFIVVKLKEGYANQTLHQRLPNNTPAPIK